MFYLCETEQERERGREREIAQAAAAQRRHAQHCVSGNVHAFGERKKEIKCVRSLCVRGRRLLASIWQARKKER